MSYKGIRKSRKERRALMEAGREWILVLFAWLWTVKQICILVKYSNCCNRRHLQHLLKRPLIGYTLQWELFPTPSQGHKAQVVYPKLHKVCGKPLSPFPEHRNTWWLQSRRSLHLLQQHQTHRASRSFSKFSVSAVLPVWGKERVEPAASSLYFWPGWRCLIFLHLGWESVCVK